MTKSPTLNQNTFHHYLRFSIKGQERPLRKYYLNKSYTKWHGRQAKAPSSYIITYDIDAVILSDFEYHPIIFISKIIFKISYPLFIYILLIFIVASSYLGGVSATSSYLGGLSASFLLATAAQVSISNSGSRRFNRTNTIFGINQTH